MKELAIKNGKFTIHNTGIEFHEDLSHEEWEKLGTQISRVGKSIGFLIGDWLNYGESRWGDAKNVASVLRLDHGYVRNLAYVSRKVSCRHDTLSFEHHAVVAKLKSPEDQKRWLAAAEKHNLSVRRLRVSMNFGRVVSIDEMEEDPADKGRPTYMTWLNKLLHWWTNRVKDDPIDQWDELDRQRLKRDLEPWVKIYEQL
jgi:hypothetical protein